MEAQLYAELLGTLCRCGATKVARQSFCGHCYRKLPVPMQHAMHRLIGNGYESAYANAVIFLIGQEGDS